MTGSSALPATVEVDAGPRRPAMDRATCSRLATVEYERFLRQLDQLTSAEAAMPTDCAGWDVTAMAQHVLGMAEMFSSWTRNARQHLPAARAAKNGAAYIDALTARQVADRAHLSLPEVRVALAAAGPRAVRWRRRSPGLLRARAMPDLQPVSGVPGGPMEAWTFGFLFDVILVRDPWMHRTDIARAVGRPLELTADHDGVIVADLVAEWSSRHTEPYDLVLTGPAGGTWSRGVDGERIEMDAIDFCRSLAGRGPTDGLLAVAVPF
jgi:uncharacterized protein (TIGR03083 family)